MLLPWQSSACQKSNFVYQGAHVNCWVQLDELQLSFLLKLSGGNIFCVLFYLLLNICFQEYYVVSKDTVCKSPQGVNSCVLCALVYQQMGYLGMLQYLKACLASEADLVSADNFPKLKFFMGPWDYGKVFWMSYIGTPSDQNPPCYVFPCRGLLSSSSSEQQAVPDCAVVIFSPNVCR